VRRALLLLVCCLALLAAGTARPGSSKQRCNSASPPAGSFADCFSGGYHGTGFMPMEETIHFRLVTDAALRSSALWRSWLADAKKFKTRPPCANDNALPFTGSFSFYGGGSFVACSEAHPFRVNGYFKVKKPFSFEDEETKITLTHGVFFATSDLNNVVELVFSDAVHEHFAQPEVVLGPPYSASKPLTGH
jgi:hypothetical protein